MNLIFRMLNSPFYFLMRFFYTYKIKKMAFQKGCMYAIQHQIKDEWYDPDRIPSSIAQKNYSEFVSRLTTLTMVHIARYKLEDVLKPSFGDGYRYSWFFPTIVTKTRAMNRIEYLDIFGKKSYLKMVWSHYKKDKNALPILVEAKY